MKVSTYRSAPAKRADRKVDELVGICRGLLADGALNSSEAAFLLDWLQRNAAFADRYPFNALYARVATALVDGVVDHDEESDLLATLAEFVGGECCLDQEEVSSLSTALPFCRPVPRITYDPAETYFCITGTFSFGPRAEVMRALVDKDVYIDNSVLKRTNYLVVGEFASREWVHSSYGRKIERAIDLRESGHPIAIVSEKDWVLSL